MTVVRQSWRCRSSLIGISIYSSNYHYAQIMFVRMFSSVTLQAENGTAFGSQSMLYLIKGRRENFVINTMLMRLSYPSIFQNEITCLYKLFTSLQINMTKKSQSEILICWMFLGFTKRSCLKTTSCLSSNIKIQLRVSRKRVSWMTFIGCVWRKFKKKMKITSQNTNQQFFWYFCNVKHHSKARILSYNASCEN